MPYFDPLVQNDLYAQAEPDYGPSPEELNNFWQMQDRYAGGPPGALPMDSGAGMLPDPGSTWRDRIGAALSQVQFPQSRRPNAVGGFLQGFAGGFSGANMADQRFRGVTNERVRAERMAQNRANLEATQRERDRQMRLSLAAQILRARRSEKLLEAQQAQQAEAAKLAAENDPRLAAQRGRIAGIEAAAKNAVPGSSSTEAADSGMTLSPDALTMAALMYVKSGQLPPMGMSKNSIAVREKILNEAAKLGPNADIATNRAMLQTTSRALGSVRELAAKGKAFERTLQKNSDMLRSIAQKLPDTGSRLLNAPLRASLASLGNVQVSNFDAALQPVQVEAARLLSSPTGAGQLTDESRRELQAILGRNFTLRQLNGALNVLRQDAINRTTEYDGQVKELEGQIRGIGKPAAASSDTVQIQPGGLFDRNRPRGR